MKYIIVFLLLFSLNSFSQNIVPNIDNMMKHLYWLSDSARQGRLSGTKQYDESIEYCKKYILSTNAKPFSQTFWSQDFPIDVNEIKAAEVFIENDKEFVELQAGGEFSVRGYSGSGNIEAEVVFCGYGVDSEFYSDYKNIDVNGKVVMIFKQSPKFVQPFIDFSIRQKADFAYKRGAIGVIFVNVYTETNREPNGSVMHGDGPMHTDFPQIQISAKIADKIMCKTGYSLKTAQIVIDSTKNSFSLYCKSNIKIKVEADYNPVGKSSNIVAVLNGKDKKMKDEYIVVMAHLDHVGAITSKLLFPGANDNASGSAAVLELTNVFSKIEKKLKRSVLFVLLGSEEKGLYGSQYFVDNLPVSKEKIVAAINMDCIGVGDSITIGNGKSSPDLWNIAKNIDAKNDNLTTSNTWSGGGADLTPFYKKGIHGLYFVTKNSHKYLHLPSDTPSTINKDIYAKIVKLVYLFVYELAVEGVDISTSN